MIVYRCDSCKSEVTSPHTLRSAYYRGEYAHIELCEPCYDKFTAECESIYTLTYEQYWKPFQKKWGIK